MNKMSISCIVELFIHLFANQLKFKYLVNNFSRILYSVSVFFFCFLLSVKFRLSANFKTFLIVLSQNLSQHHYSNDHFCVTCWHKHVEKKLTLFLRAISNISYWRWSGSQFPICVRESALSTSGECRKYSFFYFPLHNMELRYIQNWIAEIVLCFGQK